MDYLDHDSDALSTPESPSSNRRNIQRRKGGDADGFVRPHLSRSHSSMALSPASTPPTSRLNMKNSVSRAATPSSPYARSPHCVSILEKENALHPMFTPTSSPVDRSNIPKRNSSYMGPSSLPLPNGGHGDALTRLSVSMLELPTFSPLPTPNFHMLPSPALTSSQSTSIISVSPALQLRAPMPPISASSSATSLSAPEEDDSFLWDGSFSSENSSFSSIDYNSDEENRVPHILPTKPSRHSGLTSVSGSTVGFFFKKVIPQSDL